jgi:hypothetical protein
VIGARRGISGGVLVLLGEAFVDLLLLPLRVVASLLLAGRWREQTRRLILSKAIHAPQDAHPAR